MGLNRGFVLVSAQPRLRVAPEAALAREKKLSYATLALSMNHAAGLGTSADGIKLADADQVLAAGMEKVRLILARAVEMHAALPATERGLA